MSKLVALLNPDLALFAVAEVRFKYPQSEIFEGKAVVDFHNEQMMSTVGGIMMEEAIRLGVAEGASISEIPYDIFTEVIFWTWKRVSELGIRLYCLGDMPLDTRLTTAEIGTTAEYIIKHVYNFDGFRVLHWHTSASSEHGFDLIVRCEENGALGIVEVKCTKRKGHLRSYLPIVRTLGVREMSITWIKHHTELMFKKNAELASELIPHLDDARLERFVIVLNTDGRSIRFFINEHFYDTGIDDYLVGGAYREELKSRIHNIDDDLDHVCEEAHKLWLEGEVEHQMQEMRAFGRAFHEHLNLRSK